MADDVRSDAQGENHELTDVDEEAGHERLSPGAAPREMYIPQDEATAFIESLMEQEGFWEGVGEKGCALFPVCGTREFPPKKTAIIVAGARIEVAYEEHRAFAENMRRMVEGDPWSIRDKPLLARCEHDSGATPAAC
ncbi:MYND finger protein [Aureococcus anophagefferens]|uniref:MYND finger protein n=1 Tax=Aureococcus anophagefferens TaxID=44056 RepID=A0ABR1G4R4_AURAN